MRSILIALMMMVAGPAFAQFPNKQLTFVVPYAPGGTADIVTRLYAQYVGEELGQTVVVENRPGANGNIGVNSVATAAPDGYTLTLCAIGACASNASLYEMPYDVRTALRPVFWAASTMNMLTIRKDLGVSSVAEFVELAKSRELLYSSSGAGSAHHLSSELLGSSFGVKFVHVPFSGAAPALQELLAGRIDFMVENVSTVIPHYNEGNVGGLAVTGPQRHPSLPDTPTLVELGYDDLVIQAWFGFAGPAGMPDDVTATLNAAFNAAFQRPEVQERYKQLGLIPEGGEAERFAQHIQSEITRWEAVVKERGITPQ